MERKAKTHPAAQGADKVFRLDGDARPKVHEPLESGAGGRVGDAARLDRDDAGFLD